MDAVAVVFRNTSDVEIDAPGFTVVDPSIPVWFDISGVVGPGMAGYFSPGSLQNPSFFFSAQMASGSGKNRQVATVTLSGETAMDANGTPNGNQCRFNAQVVVQRERN